MIKALIIDDEQHCIDRLKKLLQNYCSDTIDLCGSFMSFEEGLQALKKIKPDLISRC